MNKQKILYGLFIVFCVQSNYAMDSNGPAQTANFGWRTSKQDDIRWTEAQQLRDFAEMERVSSPGEGFTELPEETYKRLDEQSEAEVEAKPKAKRSEDGNQQESESFGASQQRAFNANQRAREAGAIKPQLASRKYFYMGLGFLTADIAGLVAYKKSPQFKEYVDGKASSAKNTVLRKVVVPCYFKVQQIKEEGFSKKDVAIGLACVAGIYCIKKAGDYLHLWQAIAKRDFIEPKAILKDLGSRIAKHKVVVSICGIGALAAGYWLKIRGQKEMTKEVPTIDVFFKSLSQEQQKAVEKSSELKDLVSQAEEDPLALQKNESFMSLLSGEQAEQLNLIVDDYLNNNPHLGLMD